MMRRVLKLALAIVVATIAGAGYYIHNVIRDMRGIFSINDNTPRSKTEYIIVHHDDVPRPMALYEIQQTHLQRWHDYFPYTLFCMDGKVYLTRELEQKTSHAIGYNKIGIAVCIHTDSKKNWQDMFHLMCCIKFLQWYYDVPTENVLGHGETDTTKCPELDMVKLRHDLDYETKWIFSPQLTKSE